MSQQKDDNYDPLHDEASGVDGSPSSPQRVADVEMKPAGKNTKSLANDDVPNAIAVSSSAVSTAAVVVASTSDSPIKERKAARAAYESGDVEASRLEHEKNEPHSVASGELVKALVFGGLDGVMTIFAVVTAAAGPGGNWQVILVFGLANLVADAWAMGFGEFLGGTAEMDHARSEKLREEWEYDTVFEEEKEELMLIYMKRGYPEDDAQALVDILAKHKEHFIDAMMKDELGITDDLEDSYGPMKCGIVMFLAFCVFGMIPLVPYFGGVGKGTDSVFWTSCALVGVALLVLGCLKGYLTDRPIGQMALNMLFAGIVSGLVSYLIASILAVIIA